MGRALLEIGEVEQAERELKEVLRLAPENLAGLRGLAEALDRRGDRASALAHYEIALALAPRDVDLQQTVAALRSEVPAPSPAASRPQPAPTACSDAEAPNGLPHLERWLALIVADRERRQSAVSGSPSRAPTANC